MTDCIVITCRPERDRISAHTPKGVSLGTFGSMGATLPILLEKYGPDQIVTWKWFDRETISFEPLTVAQWLNTSLMRPYHPFTKEKIKKLIEAQT